MRYLRRNGRAAPRRAPVGARRLTVGRRTTNTRADGLPRQVLALLAQPLDPALISEREARDGRVLQYIEGWAAINQANRIFGHDGWGAEVIGEVGYRPLSLAEPDTGEAVAVGMYAATVRVSVRGCPPKADVGCSFLSQDTPEAHEAAYKGAVTDAMKRALRHFGDQFANRLYDRRNAVDPASPKRAAPASPARLEAMRRKVLDLSGRLGVDEGKARAWAQKRYGQPLDALGEQELADAVRSLAEQLNQRNGLAADRRSVRRLAA
ncbi:MAG: Rad52/Rad22 family DNA repair protein [Chloroflexota bacterium]|nr:Rad52/Rad22 family DNA repair protein [Chloroflexota bacterium]